VQLTIVYSLAGDREADVVLGVVDLHVHETIGHS
jgi:hypothetical protein